MSDGIGEKAPGARDCTCGELLRDECPSLKGPDSETWRQAILGALVSEVSLLRQIRISAAERGRGVLGGRPNLVAGGLAVEP